MRGGFSAVVFFSAQAIFWSTDRPQSQKTVTWRMDLVFLYPLRS